MRSSIATDSAIKIEINGLELYFFKACRKGDATVEVVTVGDSAVRVLADANEITGLPRDTFKVWEITREEFESLSRK